MGEQLRIVLDTNVVLDWLVFDDASIASLRAAHAAGQLRLLARADTLSELARVLAYPLFALSVATQLAALGAYRALRLPEEPIPAPVSTASPRKLPLCRDLDDQKFLELARDQAADYLLSKDKRLLELNRRKFALPFEICTPSAFTLRLADSAQA